jgi:16S rRNA (cytosine967-C5)-methyltransferase
VNGRRPHGLSQRDRTELLPMLWDLWTRYAAAPAPPHLDRWLARELSGLDGLKRTQRLWLGAQLTHAVRFAWLALLCHEASGRPPRAALAHARAGVSDSAGTWQRLQAVPPPALFFWVFLRRREDGGQPPRLDEPRPGAVNDWHRLRSSLAGETDLGARLIWAGLPVTLREPLQRRRPLSGWTESELRLFVDRQAQRPPLWLRVRRLEDRQTVIEELRAAGFRVEVHDLALAADGDRGIYDLACHREGLVEIQDLASQAIGQAVQAEKGQFIWDCCAGGGGKSLQLAAAMGNTGAVYATDASVERLADLRRRVKRAGFTCVRAHAWDGAVLPDFGRTVARRGGFDRVLVDAPCSGSGTWRRNPDGRLRADLEDLAPLAALQGRLLAVAAGAVKPGGRLIYATCSWLPAENEEVVAAFLAARADFALCEQGLRGNPAQDADTVFCAVLERTRSNGMISEDGRAAN